MESIPVRYAFHVEVMSHGFRVSEFNDSGRRLLTDFARNYTKTESAPDKQGRYITEVKKVYATATRFRDQFFFHRNTLDEFYQFMENHGVSTAQIQRVDRPMYEPASAHLEWIRHEITLREEQVELGEFCAQLEPRTKLITNQPGQGKTIGELGIINKLQTRTIMLMKPSLMQQWEREILKTFDIAKGELLIATGAKAMRKLITLAQEDASFTPSIIMISSSTYRDYLRSYLDHPENVDSLYGCAPWEFFEQLQGGLVVVDEVHLDFHFNYLVHCLSHMPNYNAMSGTMVSDDAVMNRFYRIMFPTETHAPRAPLRRYMDVYDVLYRFERPDKIRSSARGAYSQSTFETSIMRHKRTLANYTAMIGEMVSHQFFKHYDYRPGMKVLVFCDLVEMCTVVRDALKAKFPDRTITRFCATVDPETNLYDESIDCVVTTLRSCGVGRDIPNVTTCISSVAISSRQASEQLVHRLREPREGSRWYGTTPRFIFLSNRDNQKHQKYLKDRRHKLAPVIRNFNSLASTFVL